MSRKARKVVLAGLLLTLSKDLDLFLLHYEAFLNPDAHCLCIMILIGWSYHSAGYLAVSPVSNHHRLQYYSILTLWYKPIVVHHQLYPV